LGFDLASVWGGGKRKTWGEGKEVISDTINRKNAEKGAKYLMLFENRDDLPDMLEKKEEGRLLSSNVFWDFSFTWRDSRILEIGCRVEKGLGAGLDGM